MQECNNRRLAFRCGDFYLPILLWADNFWLLAHTLAELQVMLGLWLRIIGKEGWYGLLLLQMRIGLALPCALQGVKQSTASVGVRA